MNLRQTSANIIIPNKHEENVTAAHSQVMNHAFNDQGT